MKISVIQMEPYWLLKEKNSVEKKKSGKITFNPSQHSISISFATTKAALVVRGSEEMLRYSLIDETLKLSCSYKQEKTNKILQWYNSTKKEIFKVLSKGLLVKLIHNDTPIAQLRYVSEKKAIFTIHSTNTYPIAILLGSILPLLVDS